jgi:hypothetical protein
MGQRQSGELPVKKLIKRKKFSDQIEKTDMKVNLRLNPPKITKPNDET